MIYFANPSTPDIRAAMTAGRLGCIVTPKQGNLIPDGALYCADNGKYGKGWPGTDAWWLWLMRTIGRYGTERCAFAVAPDTVADPDATLTESLPWLPRIRALGVPAAFVAQDGCEHDNLIPWGQFDILFIGGTTEWKLSPAAAGVAAQAKDKGIPVHMGRVNSGRRLRLAHWFGADSVDGTYMAFAPDVNLPRVEGWLHHLRTNPTLFDQVE